MIPFCSGCARLRATIKRNLVQLVAVAHPPLGGVQRNATSATSWAVVGGA